MSKIINTETVAALMDWLDKHKAKPHNYAIADYIIGEKQDLQPSVNTD